MAHTHQARACSVRRSPSRRRASVGGSFRGVEGLEVRRLLSVDGLVDAVDATDPGEVGVTMIVEELGSDGSLAVEGSYANCMFPSPSYAVNVYNHASNVDGTVEDPWASEVTVIAIAESTTVSVADFLASEDGLGYADVESGLGETLERVSYVDGTVAYFTADAKLVSLIPQMADNADYSTYPTTTAEYAELSWRLSDWELFPIDLEPTEGGEATDPEIFATTGFVEEDRPSEPHFRSPIALSTGQEEEVDVQASSEQQIVSLAVRQPTGLVSFGSTLIASNTEISEPESELLA